MINEIKLKFRTEETTTTINANIKPMSLEEYKQYLTNNKYYLFYLMYKGYTDQVNKYSKLHDTFMILFETENQKIFINHTDTCITEIFEMWYKEETKLINIFD